MAETISTGPAVALRLFLSFFLLGSGPLRVNHHTAYSPFVHRIQQVKYLATKQSVLYHRDVKQCLTRDNVPIAIRATAAFRVMGDAERGEDPALVRKFAYELGVRGLEAQLSGALVSMS